ncbi:MAG: tyrosine-type recombinase/integrase, partial [Flavobacteriales bacterium]|nr:tyrosine-type recombinase/integrase [Flavobacteriales bacterium]
MEGINNLLDKLSLEDIEKLRLLFAVNVNSNSKPDQIITLRVFSQEYKEHIKANRTVSYYRSVINAFQHFEKYFGVQRALNTIAYKDVEMFVTHLQQKVTKGYRVYYRTLKAAFNKAIDWGYVTDNHFIKVKLPKKVKLNPTFINSTELQKIVDCLPNQLLKDAIVFGFSTGLRLSEIVNLKWTNIDFASKVIIVGDEEFTTKGKNQRYVPFGEEVQEILKGRIQNAEFRIKNVKRSEKAKSKSEISDEHNMTNGNAVDIRSYSVVGTSTLRQGSVQAPHSMANSNKVDIHSHSIVKGKYVFGKENGFPFTGDYFSKNFKKAVRAANLDEGIHFHTLRHSFASNLAQKGVSIYVIKELLGHSSVSTTEIYSHL